MQIIKKTYFPKDCSKVKNNTDIQSVLKSSNTQNDVLKAWEETLTTIDNIKSGLVFCETDDGA
jgi:hypothetical protein